MRRRLVAAALGAAIASAHYPGANRGYRGMSEKERVDYFHKNGYEWPPTSTRGWPPQPATPSDAYRTSRDEIEAWIRRNLTTYKATFDEWGTLSQSRRMPAFTRNGFEVFDLSHTASYAELAANYERNVNDPAAFANLRPEGMSSGSSTGRPKFYHQGSLNNRLLDELRPRMEAWAGVAFESVVTACAGKDFWDEYKHTPEWLQHMHRDGDGRLRPPPVITTRKLRVT